VKAHDFTPCLRDGEPGHNFTCALLCTECGLPREKHPVRSWSRGAPMSESAMVPKAYAALSDALDESLGFALNRVIERLPVPDSNDAELHAWREEVKEQMRNEVMNAICERFAFVEPKEE
jgi:hypothetical protein